MPPSSAAVKRDVKNRVSPIKSVGVLVRCPCGKCLGAWDGETLVIRRVGLILRGGWHEWTCWGCGRTSEIDLRRLMEPV